MNEVIQLVASCLKRSVADLSCGLCMPSLMVCCPDLRFSLVDENYYPPPSVAEYYLTTKKRRAVKAQGASFSNG